MAWNSGRGERKRNSINSGYSIAAFLPKLFLKEERQGGGEGQNLSVSRETAGCYKKAVKSVIKAHFRQASS